MIVGTYLPFDKKKWPKKIECFKITSPDGLVANAIKQSSALPEVLFIFESESSTVNDIPARCIPLQIGEVITGDAFICNGMQDEVYPKEQAILRKHAEGYIHFAGMNKELFKGKDDYDVFVSLQKKSFEMHMLPAWSEFIWAQMVPGYEWKNKLSRELTEEEYKRIYSAASTEEATDVVSSIFKEG